MRSGAVAVMPLAEAHREGLRAAVVADDPVWEIYSHSLVGAAFDPAFEAKLAGGGQLAFALMRAGRVLGCSSYYAVEPGHGTLAIGYSYVSPAARGSGLNMVVKALLVARAWACGFHRVHFDVDVRNQRSVAAVEKLGAVREGVLRKNRTTWTGHVRDTMVLGLLKGEESAALRAAMAAV
jgi:RimJ/RimL family protein N-acetyltransferase